MDLQQNKLTRAEWNSIEEPVSSGEKEILQMIIDGFVNPSICKNKTMSLFTFTKIEPSEENEKFLFDKYFDSIIKKMVKKYGESLMLTESMFSHKEKETVFKKMKSIDALRLQNLEQNIEKNKEFVYEFLLLDLCGELMKNVYNKKPKFSLYHYTLLQIQKATISSVNTHVENFIQQVLKKANSLVDLSSIVEYAYEFIEQNRFLLEYQDRTLFDHQKQLFSIFQIKDLQEYVKPKLVLYIAPTGTGKTLSPLGLSNKYRIIFVCVARHIGLALAKSAIAMEKKIAFAFGAETADDIRLHYYSAVDFTRDTRSGGIRKVDNSNGAKVEIMICDVKSYITSMYYMLSFNPAERIITFWDEPTITMDYETHNLHDTIHKNWAGNKIPNIVLSCATLPREDEIYPVIADFKSQFDDAELHNITSYDFRKSIPIVSKDGFCAIPHTMYESYDDLIKCVHFCSSNKTLLRYFDLQEIVQFLFYINKTDFIEDTLKMSNYFASIADITMMSIKEYYLEVLKRVDETQWPEIYNHMKSVQQSKFVKKPSKKIVKSQSADVNLISSVSSTAGGGSLTRTHSISSTSTSSVSSSSVSSSSKTVPSNGLLITTEDAHSLTDGPTIYLCEDVSKIGNFYIQQTGIPQEIMQQVMRTISRNDELSASIAKLEQIFDDLENKSNSKTDDASGKKASKEFELDKKSPEIRKMYQEIEDLKRQVKYIAMDPLYVPNTKQHQVAWAPIKGDEINAKCFVPSIDETSVKEIMSLQLRPDENDKRDNYLKVLLLLGIGLFMEGIHPKYLEIVKTLAQQQNLYLIIASSDYIYGTNYSFCHGFLGRDLANMTQQKTLQCLGRIGRGQIQQTYTVRFRDDDMLRALFKDADRNIEAENMCRLFTSD